MGEVKMDCPSAQPEMSNARVLGIIETGSTNRQLSYVNEPLSVSSGLIKAYKLHNLSDKVRFSATCEESKCTHFDGVLDVRRFKRMLNPQMTPSSKLLDQLTVRRELFQHRLIKLCIV